jgi:hypothetical protein
MVLWCSQTEVVNLLLFLVGRSFASGGSLKGVHIIDRSFASEASGKTVYILDRPNLPPKVGVDIGDLEVPSRVVQIVNVPRFPPRVVQIVDVPKIPSRVVQIVDVPRFPQEWCK